MHNNQDIFDRSKYDWQTTRCYGESSEEERFILLKSSRGKSYKFRIYLCDKGISTFGLWDCKADAPAYSGKAIESITELINSYGLDDYCSYVDDINIIDNLIDDIVKNTGFTVQNNSRY